MTGLFHRNLFSLRSALVPAIAAAIVLCMLPETAQAVSAGLARSDIQVPAWDQVLRVLSLRDYNTRVVVLGTMLLGLAAGLVGSFMLLHKQSLLGDALSHATLPGIGLAFIFGAMAGGSGKSLAWMLIGAVVTGTLGIGFILLVMHYSRLKQDTALGIVLSVFFGAGVAILGIIQKMQTGHAAGLESFIYGKTASMRSQDAWLIAITAAIVAVGCVALLKEFLLICFDQGFARAQGWPVVWMEIVLMTMVTAVTVVGLQAVGLILIVALLIIPPAAARFWTNRLVPMLLISAGIGACSSAVGAGISAVVPNLPSGAMIVIVAAVLFLVSMVFAPARGVLIRSIERVQLNRRISHQHLLRAMYEHAELASGEAGPAAHNAPVPFQKLLRARSWSAKELRRALRAAESEGLLERRGDRAYVLTEQGLADAARLTRNHRLWELYLIHFADVAPSHVDRDAEEVEHILGHDMVEHLERLLPEEARTDRPGKVPASPHLPVADDFANGEGVVRGVSQ